MPTVEDWADDTLSVMDAVGSDRVLATVLFTDIMDSTQSTVAVGDRRQRDMLDRHDRIAWRAADRHRGTLVKNMGDALLMTFGAPSEGVACAKELVHELSPPESVHALDTSGLQGPDITFWSVREGATLLGCGALRELDPEHGEIKSMRRAPVG